MNHVNTDDEFNNQFVLIPSKVLREMFTKDYSKKFLSQMVASEIIKRSPYFNNHVKELHQGFGSDNKPFGYRINDNLLNFNELDFVRISDDNYKNRDNQIPKVIKDIKLLDFDTAKMLDDVNNYNIDSLIKVNQQITDTYLDVIFPKSKDKHPVVMKTEKAQQQAGLFGKDLIQYKSYAYIENVNYFKKTKTNQFKISQIHCISKLISKDFFASINDTNYRLDTTLTNLKSTFFKNGRVTLYGEKIVDIDLKNSQPTLLAFLLSNLDAVKKTFNNLTDYKFPDVYLTVDLESFFELAGDGQLYDYISSITGQTRSEAKLSFIRILFSKLDWNSSQKKKVKELFPTLIKWIDLFKRENGNHKSLYSYPQI